MSLINNKSSTCAIKEGNNIIFYINTGGFPLTQDAWIQMWDYAKELQPEYSNKMDDIREKCDELPVAPVPVVPYAYIYNRKLSNGEKLEKIQTYINELQYNHTGLQFFDIRKDRPLVGLVDVAKKIIDDSLPIKCLEAVILAIYLTNEIASMNTSFYNLEKFTIGFKTTSKGNVHRHVVLGVYCHVTGLFGALGISRRSDLGYKELKFKTLTDLMIDFVESYDTYLHKVKRVKIGMPVPGSNRSFESIPWNGCVITFNKNNESEWPKLCEKHARCIRQNSTSSNLLQTSVSLKNLTNLNANTQKVYLDKPSCFRNQALRFGNNKNVEDVKKIDLTKKFTSNAYDNGSESCEDNLLEQKIVNDLNEQDASYLPPNILNTRKSFDETVLLIKRKKKSLRI